MKNQTKGAVCSLRPRCLLLITALCAVLCLGLTTQAFATFSSESADQIIGVGRIQSSPISESTTESKNRFAVETLTTDPESTETNTLATPLDYVAAEEAIKRIAEFTALATDAAAKAAEGTGLPPQPVLLPAPSKTPTGEEPTGDNQSQDKQSFINEWAPRIDDYLAGSPLAGYGYVFANASYDYNVDPRWSPAISCLESSKGEHCFYSYNAWGWGHEAWPNWETAIYTHIKGLSVGYGYTVSLAAAQKYCPDTSNHWFMVVSNEIRHI